MMHTATAKNELSIIRKVTLVGFWINAALVLLKLFFGYWGYSDALVADGYHSVSDFITDFIVLFFIGIAYKRADKDHPYGHGKYETVATVIIGIILLIVAVFIGLKGIMNIIGAAEGKVLPKPDILTLIVTFISIFAKEFCYRYTIKYGKKINSSVVIANAWHHRSDSLSSIATLIGISFAIFLGPSWRILDPIAAVVVAVFIAVSAIKIAKPAISELLEVSLPKEQLDEISKIVINIPGVKKFHNLRSRRNGHFYIVDLNIHVDPDITVRAAHEIANDVEDDLKKHFGGDMIIYVHIEPEL